MEPCYQCEYCGKNEFEEVLIKYPVTTVFRDFYLESDSVISDSFVCVKCLMKEAKESENR